jgi:hypothetical protein
MTIREKLLAWLLGAICLGLITFGNNPYRYFRLSANGVQTTAKVAMLTPSDHNTYSFHFRVNDVYYEGRGFIDNLKTPKPGDSLTVLYVPDAPNICADCESRSSAVNRLERELSGAGVAIIVIPLMLVIVIDRWARGRRQSKQILADGSAD